MPRITRRFCALSLQVLVQAGWSLFPDGLMPFSPLPSLLVSGKEIVLDFFPALSFLSSIVPKTARVTFRTLCLWEPLRAMSLFSLATATFSDSFSSHNSSLSRSVSSPRIKVPVFIFWSKNLRTKNLSVEHSWVLLPFCTILSIQCLSRLQLFAISESHLV